MKVNQLITYVDSAGERHPAAVAAITGAGPSDYKILTVSVGDSTIENVKHFGDQAQNEGYWLLLHEKEPVVE